MSGNQPPRPETARPDVRPEAAPATASFEPGRLEATRLEKCLGGALCLVALAGGVWAGLAIHTASARTSSLEERRAEVAAMSAAEKDHLRHQLTRFTSLPPEQQDNLRQLDAELSAADDGEELRSTLRQFSGWLGTVSPTDRNELLKLIGQTEPRVVRVEELSPLSRSDGEVVDEWLKTLTGWGRWSLGAGGMRRPFGPPPSEGGPVTEADFDALAKAEGLSDLRRDELTRQKNNTDKRRLVATWLQRRRSPGEPRFGLVSNDELVRFFSEDLTEASRRRLLAMPVDQRNRELREEHRRFQRKLEQFFAEDLGEEARQRLSALSTEQRSQELRQEYHAFEKELQRYFKEELSKESQKRLSELPAAERDRELRKKFREAKASVEASSDG
jgi:hypothetical protein